VCFAILSSCFFFSTRVDCYLKVPTYLFLFAISDAEVTFFSEFLLRVSCFFFFPRDMSWASNMMHGLMGGFLFLSAA